LVYDRVGVVGFMDSGNIVSGNSFQLIRFFLSVPTLEIRPCVDAGFVWVETAID
jgi:hypothetical protein